MPSKIDLNKIVEAIGDAVVVSDAQGLITTWNPAAVRIFGFSEAEAIGRSLDLITPERQLQRHWEGYHQTMRTGITKYGSDLLRVPALHKEGRTLSIAFTVGLIFGEDGAVAGIVALIRDETVRWLEDRKLRRRVAELEAAADREGVEASNASVTSAERPHIRSTTR